MIIFSFYPGTYAKMICGVMVNNSQPYMTSNT